MPTNSKKKPLSKKSLWQRFRAWQQKFFADRPHRSFRLTKRRDAVRPIALPGNFKFTKEVAALLWKHRKTFLLLGLVYAVLYGVLVGLISQDTYTTLSNSLKTQGSIAFEGFWGTLARAGLLFAAISTNGLNSSFSSQSQQIITILLILLVWLTTVWLLRQLYAGHQVKLRDGIYNSGSPIFATLIVAIVFVLQLLPIGVACIGYSAATSSGLLASGGMAAMLFWVAAALLALLSFYWITSTFFALIIITLPGTYPLRALRIARSLVFGRRIKLLLRWLWLVLTVIVGWIVTLLPIILLDLWIESFWSGMSSIPLVPVATLVLSTLTIIWISTYVYLLYRKVVDSEDA